MSYYLTYTGSFINKRSNTVLIEIYRKDIDPGSAMTLSNKEITDVTYSYPNGNESKYDINISAEASIDLRVRTDSTITAETFLTDFYDEWKVILYLDTQIVFAGFIEPSEGNYLMKDAPLGIKLKCTDGLGLLKNVPLTDINEASFLLQKPFLKDIIAGCLAKTNLDLPFRIYCSIYESSMTDRLDSITSDMFQQARLDYRTFLNNSIDFVDCYKALEMLLTGGFSIFQWMGMWVISYRPEMQGTVGPTNYYTDYDKDGTVTGGNQDLLSATTVGFEQQQHPINLDQLIGYQFPAVSVKTQYNYEPWPEIPTNNKFERGTINLLASGPGFTIYSIDNWTYGKFINNPTQIANLPALDPTTDTAVRKSTFNSFGIEIEREVILENGTDGEHRLLICEEIPIGVGDKIRVSFDCKKLNDGIDGTFDYLCIFIIGTSGNRWNLTSANSILPDGGPLLWVDTDLVNPLRRFYTSGEVFTEYFSYTIEPPALPEEGRLFIAFRNSDSTNTFQYYRNFSVEYLPFLAGGYLQVKGDYWFTSQNVNIKDKIDEEVFISDSLRKALKGALLRADGETLTTPTWYRQGIEEEKHFKELLNLGKYRHYYRRYRKITGTFRGIKSRAENDFFTFFPVPFHKHYRFIDNDNGRLYVMAAPLTINLLEGRFGCVAVECFNSSNSSDGAVTSEQVVAQLISLTNSTVPRIPPIAIAGPTNRILFFLDNSESMTFDVSDGGAGNSPSITLISDLPFGVTKHIVLVEIGTDVMPGNIFNLHFDIPAEVSYTAQTPVLYTDSEQNGDSHFFKFIF